jgi:hypothetical protein
MTGRDAAIGRGVGRMDSGAAAIAQGLDQIGEMRAELQNLRAVIEELVQRVAALSANSPAEARGLEQATPAAADEVLIVETYGISADAEEKPQPQGAAQD